MTRSRIVRIGGASGFWGDSAVGATQLVRRAQVDYLVFDYLAEVTMSIMAKAKKRDPEAGYATDFVETAMKSVLREIVERGIRVVTNAGGVNPSACAAALRAIAADQGVAVKIAIVDGDDILPQIERLRAEKVRDMFTDAPLPDACLSANAYLGAFPIAAALAAGAQIVITGRCVDSALALGPLIHEFDWRSDDWDRLSAGTLVGHLVECGVQATGGIHTDWECVPRWEDIGFPIAEVSDDGSFVLTKPEGTGGMVSLGVVGEQFVYEIGDPGAYFMPDVTCDWTAVTMRIDGPDRVFVAGARGRAAPASLKVSATFADGYRCSGGFTVVGRDAAAKARRAGETIMARARQLLRDSNLGDFDAVEIETLGADSIYGPRAGIDSREVVLRLTVSHRDRSALAIFAREIAPMGTGGAPGSTGFSGRPKPQEIVRLFSFLLPKSAAPECAIRLDGGSSVPVAIPTTPAPTSALPPDAPAQVEASPLVGDEVEAPLVRIAWARSGDKGDICNIGVIARTPELVGIIAREVEAAHVRDWLGHLVEGNVTRYALPGVGAFNFVLENALGGGGMASLRNDPQGKAYAQLLLDLPIRVSQAALDRAAGE